MKNNSEPGKTIWFAVWFAVIAGLCALPRFGQRENEYSPDVSDSDLYLEMARVFTGDAAAFNPTYVSWQPHHYNRPLLPFLAGVVGKYVLQGNLRAAFSLINILAAAFIAVLLLRCVRDARPDARLAWLPSVLFLSGFPQVNWGYHILTDTLGIATAFGLACHGKWLIDQSDRTPAWSWPRRTGQILLLFLTSALAFLTRETAWLGVVAVSYLVFRRRSRSAACLLQYGLILAVIVAGKVPHSYYAHCFQVTGVPLKSSLASLLDWRYVLDFSVKSLVCFHVAWIAAAWWLLKPGSEPVPDLVAGWTLGALLYIGAGYFVNKINGIGYPMRMSYILFPLIYFWAGRCVGSAPARRTALAISCCVLQYVISWIGVSLDPGKASVTVTNILSLLKSKLGL